MRKSKDKNYLGIVYAVALVLVMTSVVFFLMFKNSNNMNNNFVNNIITSITTNNNYNKEIISHKGNVTDVIIRNGEIVSYKYNNFQFEKNNNVWTTEIQFGEQPYYITFSYGPIEVENISIVFNSNYFQKIATPKHKVYVTFDHDTTNASYIATSAVNLITNLKTVYGLNISRACLKNSTNCAGAPIITCQSNPNNAVIQFIESETPYAVYDKNCLTIYGSNTEFIKTTEKVILSWYKIF